MNNIIFTPFQHSWTNLCEQGLCGGDKARCKDPAPYQSSLLRRFCRCRCPCLCRCGTRLYQSAKLREGTTTTNS